MEEIKMSSGEGRLMIPFCDFYMESLFRSLILERVLGSLYKALYPLKFSHGFTSPLHF